jgi:hypothetical protein
MVAGQSKRGTLQKMPCVSASGGWKDQCFARQGQWGASHLKQSCCLDVRDDRRLLILCTFFCCSTSAKRGAFKSL